VLTDIFGEMVGMLGHGRQKIGHWLVSHKRMIVIIHESAVSKRREEPPWRLVDCNFVFRDEEFIAGQLLLWAL